jgi:hypothetical protein
VCPAAPSVLRNTVAREALLRDDRALGRQSSGMFTPFVIHLLRNTWKARQALPNILLSDAAAKQRSRSSFLHRSATATAPAQDEGINSNVMEL